MCFVETSVFSYDNDPRFNLFEGVLFRAKTELPCKALTILYSDFRSHNFALHSCGLFALVFYFLLIESGFVITFNEVL